MGGLVDGLFGSSGEPARVVDTTPEEFRGLRQPVARQLQGIFDTGGGPQFQGPFTAPAGQNEQQLLNQAMQQTTAPGLSAPARQQLQQTIQGQFLSPQSNPFLQQAIETAQRPILQAFQEQTLPRLRSDFTQAGQFLQGRPGASGEGMSSPFDMAQARAAGGLFDALGDVGTNMAFQNFAQERDRQQRAAQSAPAFDQATLQRTLQGLEAQVLPRMIEQLGIDRGQQEFNRRMNVLMQALGMGGRLAQPQTTTVAGQRPTTGLLGQVASGFAGPLGRAAAESIFGPSQDAGNQFPGVAASTPRVF